jgi:structure-specific recognition protein 1
MEDYVPPEGTTTGKGAKAGKKKKDPNAPKQGQSSFMVFSNAVRSKVKEENPDASFGDMVSISVDGALVTDYCPVSHTSHLTFQGKLIGAKFRALSPEEKRKYEELAKKDKVRATKAMAAYKEKQKEEAAAEKDHDSDGMDEYQGDVRDHSDYI